MTPETQNLEEQEDSTPETGNESPADSTWERDQKSKGYYYDDTCGYSVYDPEAEEIEDEAS